MSVQTFLNQSGSLKTRTGYDEYGKETQGVSTTVYCRFQRKSRTFLLPDGSVETQDAIVFLSSTTSINEGDHFTFATVDYRVLSIAPIIDGRGLTHHLEARLQKWQS